VPEIAGRDQLADRRKRPDRLPLPPVRQPVPLNGTELIYASSRPGVESAPLRAPRLCPQGEAFHWLKTMNPAGVARKGTGEPAWSGIPGMPPRSSAPTAYPIG